MEFKKLRIPGSYEIIPPRFSDERGCFFKTFHRAQFESHGLAVSFAEEFTTISKHGVLRGLHFQLPPHDHAKLVVCLTGEVLDVVLDLRVGSPTFGKHELVTLSSIKGNQLYLPPGTAHGFYVTSSEAMLSYCVTTTHAPDFDTGILWDSAGIEWPDRNPLLSTRDKQFTAMGDFSSPFLFSPDCYKIWRQS